MNNLDRQPQDKQGKVIGDVGNVAFLADSEQAEQDIPLGAGAESPPPLSRKVRRRRRRSRPRSKTIAMKRLTREELRVGALMLPARRHSPPHNSRRVPGSTASLPMGCVQTSFVSRCEPRNWIYQDQLSRFRTLGTSGDLLPRCCGSCGHYPGRSGGDYEPNQRAHSASRGSRIAQVKEHFSLPRRTRRHHARGVVRYSKLLELLVSFKCV